MNNHDPANRHIPFSIVMMISAVGFVIIFAALVNTVLLHDAVIAI